MADAHDISAGSYLLRALTLLRDESPRHFAAARAALAGRAAAVSVGDCPRIRVCLEQTAWVTPLDGTTALEVELSDSTLLALLRGELTLEDAVLSNQLRLRGALNALLAFLDALRAGLHGALRCPALADFHTEYLRAHARCLTSTAGREP